MHSTSQTTLFDTLCAQLHAEPDRKGECWIDCPSCGKDKKHFSFNAERGGHCFSCDYSGSLKAIAELLSITPDERARPVRRAERPARPDLWQKQPDRWLSRYGAALDRVTRWQEYKPLSLDSINHYRLGVGKLPMWSEKHERWYEYPHRRLIVPVFDVGDHRCVALHGRAFGANDTGAKWLSATGSSKRVLFNLAAVRPGCDVVICENFVDAILVQQCYSEAVAVAGGGASWQEQWTRHLAERRPRAVLVLLDNDLAGWPNEPTYHALSAAWRRERPDKPLPEPRGPKIATALLAAGVHTVRGPNWPRGTPAKWDIGSELMRGGMPS